MICECGNILNEGAVFCSACGKKVDEGTNTFCGKCGAQIKPDAFFCPSCGEPVANSRPIQPINNTYQYPDNNMYQQPVNNMYAQQGGFQQPYGYNGQADKPSTGLTVLSAFIPLAGFILWGTNKKDSPVAAKRYLHMALIGWAASFVLSLLINLGI